MRPISLTVEGFRSYAKRTTFDWTDRRLVGIVGPTGSGKSSILDAITFALYGKTPTVARDTGDLINQRAGKAIVELLFSVDGETWKVVRVISRKGQGQTQLIHLDPEDHEIETVTLKGPVNERIQRLLGLPFDGFCRSVLLAQNRFSEFLKATPAQRDEVLEGVFGFDHIRDAHDEAKRRLDAVRRDLEEFDRRRAELDADRERLERARARQEEAEARASRLRALVPSIKEIQERLEHARRRSEGSSRRMEELASAAASLGDPRDIEATLAAARDANQRTVLAAGRFERAEARYAAAVGSRRAEEEVTGGRATVERARELLATGREQESSVARARDEVRTREELHSAAKEAAVAAEREATDAESTLAKAAGSLKAASAKVAGAKLALDEARHADMATTLRASITAGALCPVCGQAIHETPKPARRASPAATAEKKLDAAEARETDARAATARASEHLAASRNALQAASADAKRTGEELASAKLSLTRAEKALEATSAQLDALLGKGDHRALVHEREERLTIAEEAEQGAQRELRGSMQDLERIRAETGRTAKAMQGVASALTAVSVMLGRRSSVAADPDEIEEALASLTDALVTERAAADDALSASRAEMASAREALEELMRNEGVESAFDDELRSAEVAERTAGNEVSMLEQRVEAGSNVGEKIQASAARRDRLERLVQDLTPARFLRFVLEEERSDLAAIGSDHCERLTDGRYRFTLDGSFDVVDLSAAETRRKADSLSGGETFLASLALALALAEMVARGGGRLDSFFLDEGFGSLDPEHLDLAMDGIERLVGGSDRRLVVLVSHVHEMRDRVEDLVELRKDPLTGETLVEAGRARA